MSVTLDGLRRWEGSPLRGLVTDEPQQRMLASLSRELRPPEPVRAHLSHHACHDIRRSTW